MFKILNEVKNNSLNLPLYVFINCCVRDRVFASIINNECGFCILVLH